MQLHPAGREQVGIYHRRYDALHNVRFLRPRHKFVHRGMSSGVLGSFAKLRQPQHDSADNPLFVAIEAVESFFGRLGDGAGDPAALAIALQCQSEALSTLPQLEQGMFEQRQCARLVGNVAQYFVHHSRLKTESYAASRFFDYLPEHVGVHRADEKLLCRDPGGEIRKRRAFRQKIRSHRAQHRALPTWNGGRVEQVCQELRALPFIAAKRENLFELVNHQDDSSGPFVDQ